MAVVSKLPTPNATTGKRNYRVDAANANRRIGMTRALLLKCIEAVHSKTRIPTRPRGVEVKDVDKHNLAVLHHVQPDPESLKAVKLARARILRSAQHQLDVLGTHDGKTMRSKQKSASRHSTKKKKPVTNADLFLQSLGLSPEDMSKKEQHRVLSGENAKAYKQFAKQTSTVMRAAVKIDKLRSPMAVSRSREATRAAEEKEFARRALGSSAKAIHRRDDDDDDDEEDMQFRQIAKQQTLLTAALAARQDAADEARQRVKKTQVTIRPDVRRQLADLMRQEEFERATIQRDIFTEEHANRFSTILANLLEPDTGFMFTPRLYNNYKELRSGGWSYALDAAAQANDINPMYVILFITIMTVILAPSFEALLALAGAILLTCCDADDFLLGAVAEELIKKLSVHLLIVPESLLRWYLFRPGRLPLAAQPAMMWVFIVASAFMHAYLASLSLHISIPLHYLWNKLLDNHVCGLPNPAFNGAQLSIASLLALTDRVMTRYLPNAEELALTTNMHPFRRKMEADLYDVAAMPRPHFSELKRVQHPEYDEVCYASVDLNADGHLVTHRSEILLGGSNYTVVILSSQPFFDHVDERPKQIRDLGPADDDEVLYLARLIRTTPTLLSEPVVVSTDFVFNYSAMNTTIRPNGDANFFSFSALLETALARTKHKTSAENRVAQGAAMAVLRLGNGLGRIGALCTAQQSVTRVLQSTMQTQLWSYGLYVLLVPMLCVLISYCKDVLPDSLEALIHASTQWITAASTRSYWERSIDSAVACLNPTPLFSTILCRTRDALLDRWNPPTSNATSTNGSQEMENQRPTTRASALLSMTHLSSTARAMSATPSSKLKDTTSPSMRGGSMHSTTRSSAFSALFFTTSMLLLSTTIISSSISRFANELLKLSQSWVENASWKQTSAHLSAIIVVLLLSWSFSGRTACYRALLSLLVYATWSALACLALPACALTCFWVVFITHSCQALLTRLQRTACSTSASSPFLSCNQDTRRRPRRNLPRDTDVESARCLWKATMGSQQRRALTPSSYASSAFASSWRSTTTTRQPPSAVSVSQAEELSPPSRTQSRPSPRPSGSSRSISPRARASSAPSSERPPSQDSCVTRRCPCSASPTQQSSSAHEMSSTPCGT